MSITASYIPVKQSGDGVTVNFPGTFPMFNKAYSRVYLENKVTGVQTLQVVDVDYTIAISGSNFTVTFLVAPPNTVNVIIARSTAQDQQTPYKTSQGYHGQVLEKSLDKLTGIVQELQEQTTRSLKLPIGSPLNPFVPDPIAGRALIWDPTGTFLINSSSNFDTLLADVTAQAAIATAAAGSASGSAATATSAAAQAVLAAGSVSYFWCGSATGTGDAIILSNANITSVQPGTKLRFLVTATNTTANPTINPQGLGSVVSRKSMGASITGLGVGDYVVGMIAEVEFDGTVWQFINCRPFSQAANFTGAASMNLTSVTGIYVPVTGNPTVTGITLPQGQWRRLMAVAGMTITNGANLICPGGADLVVPTGYCIDVHGEASGVVRVTMPTAYIDTPGRVLQFVVATSSTAADTSTVPLPLDNTIPQNTEGKLLLTGASFTPKKANSLLKIEVEIGIVGSSANGFAGAIFRDATAGATLGSIGQSGAFVGNSYRITAYVIAGSLTPTVFSFRYGTAAGAGTAYVNQSSGGNGFGGAQAAVMTITEIAQ